MERGRSDDKRGKKRTIALIVLLLLFLITLVGILLYFYLHRSVAPATIGSSNGMSGSGHTLHSAAGTGSPDSSVATRTLPADSVTGLPQKTAKAAVRGITKKVLPDSAKNIDSTQVDESFMRDSITAPGDPCAKDSILPWVYPDPSGGLHRKAVTLRFVANKPCSIQWRWSGAGSWNTYDNGVIVVNGTASLEFRAGDSCGKTMDTRTERYEIKPSDDQRRCPADMEFIAVGSMKFCIDRYEWPNKKGIRPTSRVSLYQAGDSCMVAGKRLCTTEEWQRACSGPYSWDYPYGGVYERHACVTADSGVQTAGSSAECRGYFEIFDMSGNLLEWTNTRASANNAFYNVAGGFWESGSQSGCSNVRYSYYPQNRHNPVGFRCCRDTVNARN